MLKLGIRANVGRVSENYIKPIFEKDFGEFDLPIKIIDSTSSVRPAPDGLAVLVNLLTQLDLVAVVGGEEFGLKFQVFIQEGLAETLFQPARWSGNREAVSGLNLEVEVRQRRRIVALVFNGQ
jgi:hypothetical protein